MNLDEIKKRLADYDHTWMTFAAVGVLSDQEFRFLEPELELLISVFSGFPDENWSFFGEWGGWSGYPEEGRIPDIRREWDLSRYLGYDPIGGDGRRLYHASPDVYTAARVFFRKAVTSFIRKCYLDGAIYLGILAHYVEDEATFAPMQALHRGHYVNLPRLLNISGYKPSILAKDLTRASRELTSRVKRITRHISEVSLDMRKADKEHDQAGDERLVVNACREAAKVLADAIRTAIHLAGGKRDTAANPAGPNLVKNPSFEDDDGSRYPAGWVIGWGDLHDRAGRADWEKKFDRNTRKSHTGSGSVSIMWSPKKGIEWRQRWPEALYVRPGERYYLTGWLKTHNVTGRSYLALNCHRDNNDPVKRFRSLVIRGTNDWLKLGLEVRIPAGARRARVVCRSEENDGSVWFDDVELRLLNPGEKVRSGIISRDNVVLRLRFRERGSEIQDASLYRVFNSPIITCSGKTLAELHAVEKGRRCLRFDGRDDFLELPRCSVQDPLNTRESIVVEMDLFVDCLQDSRVMAKEVDGRGYWIDLHRNGRIEFTVSDGGKAVSVSAACPMGRWFHLKGLAKKGDESNLVLNGVHCATSGASVTGLDARGADFYLASSRGIDSFFRGRIAEVRISADKE